MNSEDICERFNSFLKNKGEGTHLFQGNLHKCYTFKRVETEGRDVEAVESPPCRWDDILNYVHIHGEKDPNRKGKFYLDERCF